jgi:hypothetical protein
MKRLVVLLAVAGALCPAPRTARGIDAQLYLSHVRHLSSPEMAGRGTGSKGLRKAGQYIAREFRQIGLLSPPGIQDYCQEFPVSINARLGSHNQMKMMGSSGETNFKVRQDWIPLNFSSSGVAEAPLVFAGYGITAREYGYDDYAGLNAQGKIAVILRHEPQELDETSVFAGKVYTEHSQLASKVSNAHMHGAVAVLLVNDTAAHPGASDELDRFTSVVAPATSGIPVAQVKAEIVARWFRQAGKDFEGLQKEIDKALEPQSFAFPAALRLRLQTDVPRDQRRVCNIVGLLEGRRPEYLVIGAHYDHLGLGEQFSLAPNAAGTPHPGADDNASGTAGVIELARWFAAQGKPERGIFFVAFAGEELGLLGSSYFVNHPPVPVERIIAMINMDMIGRIREGKVYVGGTGTGSTFKSLIEEAGKARTLKLDVSESGGYGSSDHTAFTTKQIPVLFFFSGLHGDYHKPSDTWEKIDATSAAQLLELIGAVAQQLVSAAERPQFVRVAPKFSHPAASASGTGGGGSGYGPYFGSIPDFAEPPTGVRFADIREGSPAARAGLRPGDILVEFNGKKIHNLYDFTYALRGQKPGDTVEVEVIRDGQPIRAKVTLTERK